MNSPTPSAIPADLLAYVRRELLEASPVQIAGLLYDLSDGEIAGGIENDWPSQQERPERDPLVAAVGIARAEFRAAHPDVLAPEELLHALRGQVATRLFLEPDDEAFMAQFGNRGRSIPDAICLRMLIERAIVRRAAQDLLAAGCELRIHDGEPWACPLTSDLADVMNAVMATDEDLMFVFSPTDRHPRVIRFVYGNDGWDVIADYHTSLERLLAGADALAERFADLL
ncbi:Uncharacterised protein [Bordetella ansorpii]|uniref:Uncharacterized protein n=1 Tax=Bordetella ansorpii TaxID=288768 RepID=A0A157SS57_9BORD|nr:hypothetical protein [Bordetella ansorpii]SAI73144.1 Uncharacterised protein [Bordetella ansorpii]